MDGGPRNFSIAAQLSTGTDATLPHEGPIRRRGADLDRLLLGAIGGQSGAAD